MFAYRIACIGRVTPDPKETDLEPPAKRSREEVIQKLNRLSSMSAAARSGLLEVDEVFFQEVDLIAKDGDGKNGDGKDGKDGGGKGGDGKDGGGKDGDGKDGSGKDGDGKDGLQNDVYACEVPGPSSVFGSWLTAAPQDAKKGSKKVGQANDVGGIGASATPAVAGQETQAGGDSATPAQWPWARGAAAQQNAHRKWPIKAAKQYYYKFPSEMSPEDQDAKRHG